MKILFILENFYPKIGGVETLFWKLAKTLSKKGFEVTVFTSGAGDNVPQSEEIHGFKIIRTSFTNRYLFTFFTLFKAFSLARKHDVVHTTSYNAAFPAFIAASLARKKSLITFHEAWNKMWFSMTSFSYFQQILHYYFEKMILFFPFTKFVAVSNYTEEALQYAGIKNKNLVKIYNGLDYHFLESQIDPKLVKEDYYLFYGRLGISKGIPILLDSISYLKKINKPIKLKMIVSYQDDSFDQLKNDLKQRGIEHLVKLEDQMVYEDLIVQIQKAKSVLIPSFTEGFCFVAAECIALNAPIIHSGKGALKEVVSGKFVEMDSFDGNSLAVAILKADSGQWTKTEKRKFELEDSIEQYISLYKSLI